MLVASCAAAFGAAGAEAGLHPYQVTGRAPAPSPVSAPTISGSTVSGSTLSAATGSWSGQIRSYSYAWERCGSSCASISGATGSTYTLQSADVGSKIDVVVTATGKNASASATSAQVGPVSAPAAAPLPPAPTPPSPTSPPTISGSAVQGSTLSASTGSWSNSPTSYAYQWIRCDSTGGSCNPFTTGNGLPTYTLTSLDVGSTLKISVTATNAGGSASSSSTTTPVIAPTPAAAPTIAIGAPTAGATVSGSAPFTATVANGTPTEVDFTIDGGSPFTEYQSPYVYNGDGNTLDTTKLANGSHTLAAKAVFADGSSVSTSETVTVQNTVTSPAAAPWPSGNQIGFIRLGGYLSGFSNLDKYAVLITGSTGDAISKTEPGRSITYTNASGVVSAYSQGVSFTQAQQAGCLLAQASNGKYVYDHTKGSCNTLMVNGDIAFAQGEGVDGLFVDDVVPNNPYGVTTPSGWEAGMVDFIHQLHAAAQAAGLYIATNANGYNDSSLGDVNNGGATTAWVKELAPDGTMVEAWEESPLDSSKRSVGANWNQHWDTWEQSAEQIQQAGVDFLGLSYNADAVYGYASLLIADQGHAVYVRSDAGGADPWNASTWSRPAGLPLGPKTQVGACWKRPFQNFTVYVNPTTSSTTCDGHTLAATSALLQ